ncbi:MAG: hypothetical protein PWQ34_1202 [Caldanaerobacter sp.]|nr:hypothetical protein [Caldanaerobacter sp.]
MPLPKENKVYTYEDYIKWSGNEKIESICRSFCCKISNWK